jgi:hypothetical protein
MSANAGKVRLVAAQLSVAIRLISNEPRRLQVALSFAKDIRPCFRDGDVKCMGRAGVKLDDPAWMRVPANAQSVYEQVASGHMPPDAPWPADRVSLFKQWIDAGYPA